MILANYSAIAISISGGKDSQTILGVMMRQIREQSWGGQVLAIHADTGGEWHESLPHCRMLCEHYGIPLMVAVPHRSLPDHIERRCLMMSKQQPRGKPGWPSPAQRYCTSDCKRGPIESVVRAAFPAGGKPGWPSPSCRYCTSHCKVDPISKVVRGEFPAALGLHILCVTGERREESPHRAKLLETEPDARLSAGRRTVTKHRPILDYTLPMVWAHISDTGLPRHVAYDRGNARVSCALCVMASKDDIRRGAEARPDLAERFLRIERQTGFTFRPKQSLASILERPFCVPAGTAQAPCSPGSFSQSIVKPADPAPTFSVSA